MKLSRIRLVNFRQHADTTIDFERGLTGIIGPNGAGKSTILEAVAWALYGGDTARGGKDSIRFVRAAARAQVHAAALLRERDEELLRLPERGAQGPHAAAFHGGIRDGEAWDAACPFFQEGADFGAGEMRTDAAMRAGQHHDLGPRRQDL